MNELNTHNIKYDCDIRKSELNKYCDLTKKSELYKSITQCNYMLHQFYVECYATVKTHV